MLGMRRNPTLQSDPWVWEKQHSIRLVIVGCNIHSPLPEWIYPNGMALSLYRLPLILVEDPTSENTSARPGDLLLDVDEATLARGQSRRGTSNREQLSRTDGRHKLLKNLGPLLDDTMCDRSSEKALEVRIHFLANVKCDDTPAMEMPLK
jgi:hypothetical protein